MKNLLRILGFFKDFKWRIIMVIIVGCASFIMFAFMPASLNNCFNELEKWIGLDPEENVGNPALSVLKYLIIFGALAIFNALFDTFCTFTIYGIEEKVVIKKMCEVKHKLDVVPTEVLEKYSYGDLSRRVAVLSYEMIENFLNTVYTICRVTVFFISTSIVMFMLSPILATVVVCSLPICILTARIVSHHTQKYFNNFVASSSQTYNYVDQKFSLQEFFAIHGLTDSPEKFKAINNDQTKARIGEDTATAFNTVYINYIQNFMYLAVTFIFGILYINGMTEFGALPAFIMYSNRFLSNSIVVSTATSLLQGITSKSKRVFEILDCPDDVTEKEHIEIQKIKNGITFSNVSLDRGNEKLLNKISFTIPQGTNVAFVGPSASGKTYLVDLLTKLSQPTSGTITVDGINLDEITSKSYYKCVGIANESPFLFRGTVAENLLYGIRRELPENVMSVTEKLGSDGFINALPNGYETILSDNASIFNHGQKQAICVARLALQNPDIAIFHESMSATDTMTEKNVFERIMKLNKKQTTIFVTHRLGSIESCDVIYYMERGRIVESGTHAELMARKGRYYTAYNE